MLSGVMEHFVVALQGDPSRGIWAVTTRVQGLRSSLW